MERQSRKKLYLDICTLCRPFDDQSLMRIRLETDAYYLILQALQDARYAMLSLLWAIVGWWTSTWRDSFIL